MINCIIIEDQMPAQRILKKYIEDIGSLNLIGSFTDAVAAMEILNSGKVGLIFLDIHLPKISGIEFLKSLSSPPKVILTTAFPDYALESYELDVIDYLLKPFSFQRFVKAISKLSNREEPKVSNNVEIHEQNASTGLYIKSGHDHIRIKVKDIIFIKSDADYTELHFEGKMHLSTDSLKYWEDILPGMDFIRIHKSFIINTKKIEKISGNQIFLTHNQRVPIGRAYKSDFINQYLNQ